MSRTATLKVYKTVLLAMHANVEDRGIKGECTPLMEAASAGHLDIVRLLVAHGADVNAQSTSVVSGIGQLAAKDGKHLGDPEVLRRLTSSVSCALDEAAAALTRMRSDNPPNRSSNTSNGSTASAATVANGTNGQAGQTQQLTQQQSEKTSLVEACTDGDVRTVRKLLTEGRSVHETSEEGESLLSLACSAGYFELAQVSILQYKVPSKTTHLYDPLNRPEIDWTVLMRRIALERFSFDPEPITATKLVKKLTNLVKAFDVYKMYGLRYKHPILTTVHLKCSVARLLLDSGAQVNMPTDSFESPLTLAACGGHVDLAMLLIERGANIEEVNDEGYTPLMEAAREGHEEMVHLLLGQDHQIERSRNTNKENGKFPDSTNYSIYHWCYSEKPPRKQNSWVYVNICIRQLRLDYTERVPSELNPFDTFVIKELRISRNYFMRQTTNNDHTPLSLACAGGHLPVVELLLSHNADPNHKLKDNSTMLIEAAKGGHTNVVQLLLDYPHSMQPMMLNQHQQGATAATNLSMLPGQVGSRDSPLPPGTLAPSLPTQPINFFQPPTAVLQEVPDAVRIIQQEEATNSPIDSNKQVQQQPSRNSDQSKVSVGRKILPKSRSTGAVFDGNLTSAEAQQVRTQPLEFEDEVFMANAAAVDFLNKDEPNNSLIDFIKNRKKQQFSGNGEEGSSQKQQILEELHRVERDLHGKTQAHNHVFQYGISQEQCPTATNNNTLPHMLNIDIAMQQQKQQGLGTGMLANTLFPGQNLQVHNAFYTGGTQCLQAGAAAKLQTATADTGTFVQQNQKQPNSQQPSQQQQQQPYYFSPMPNTSSASVAVSLATANGSVVAAGGTGQPVTNVAAVSTNTNQQPAAAPAQVKFPAVTSHADVSQNTAISDRPKAKPVSKKEGKNLRKQQSALQQQQTVIQQQQTVIQQQQQQQQQSQEQVQATFQSNLYAQQPSQFFGQLHHLPTPQQLQVQQPQFQQQDNKVIAQQEILNVQGLDLASIDEDTVILKNDNHENFLTASILQQFHSSSIPALRATFVGSPQKTRLELYDHSEEGSKVTKLELSDSNLPSVEEVVQQLESFNTTEVSEQNLSQHNLQVQPYPSALDESMIASLAAQQDLPAQADLSRVEYFAVPTNTSQVPVHALYPYEHYLGAGLPKDQLFQAGFQAGYSLMQQQLACPNASATDTLTTTNIVPTSVGPVPGTSTQQYITPQQQPVCTPAQTPCNHLGGAAVSLQQTHHCQMPCSQHQSHQQTNQVQAATQTAQGTQAVGGDNTKKVVKSSGGDGIKFKKGRMVRNPLAVQNSGTFPPSQNYQIDHNSDSSPVGKSAFVVGIGVVAQQELNDGKVASCTCEREGGVVVVGGLTPKQRIDGDQSEQETPEKNDKSPESKSKQSSSVRKVIAFHQIKSPADRDDFEATGNEVYVSTKKTKPVYDEPPAQTTTTKSSTSPKQSSKREEGWKEVVRKSSVQTLTASESGVKKVSVPLNAISRVIGRGGSNINAIRGATGAHIEVEKQSKGQGERIITINGFLLQEHRNVSDYTPLSLAASGGYVNIIKLLLSHGAEINSRTGSKLGISPLMLAAMNGHTAAVKLLLDMGSDINAQIETNRNTALTLACFQGRHEVVSLLLDRKANVEHRAKTGLTPLMEAASGGYVDVGRVLLDKGADVNATPVPSSRDTALTIAADKGHVRFVELLLCRGAQVEVKNKKGNSPLWLAANGGHLPVVELLYNVKADIDSQDNRKVSCLMAAFRKGHFKVVKWMVHHVTQFPSDQEMMRYNATVSDKELLEKCQECVKIIRAAKETQAAKANKNASILLEELESEKTREESKRLAAARRRERKKKKKLEKKEERRKLLEENKKNENYDDKADSKDEEKVEEEESSVPEVNPTIRNGDSNDKEEGDSGIDANSQGSCSSADLKSKDKRKEKKKKKTNMKNNDLHSRSKASSSKNAEKKTQETPEKNDKSPESKSKQSSSVRKVIAFHQIKSPADRDDFEATGNEVYVSTKKTKPVYDEPPAQTTTTKSSTSPKQSSKREEGWKEVVRKSSVQTLTASESGVKKVSVPLNAISRVIGRGGSNINAIRGATGAHIEVEKQSKGQGERIITIKGSADATKQAHNLIATLIKDPDVDILSMLPKSTKSTTIATTLWDKTQIGTKKNVGKTVVVSSSTTSVTHAKVTQTTATATIATNRFSTTTAAKPRTTNTTVQVRATAPRLVAQAEKNAAAQAQNQSVRTSISHPTSVSSRLPMTSKVITSSINQTFAAKLTETSSSGQLMINTSHSVPSKVSRVLVVPQSIPGPVSPQLPSSSSANTQSSPNRNARPPPTASAPPNMQHFQSPGKVAPMFSATAHNNTAPQMEPMPNNIRSSTPNGALHLSFTRQACSKRRGRLDGWCDVFERVASYSTALTQQQPSAFPLKEQATVFNSLNGTKIEEYLLAIGNNVNPKNILFCSRISGNRICMYLSSKAIVDEFMKQHRRIITNYQEQTKAQNPLPPIGSNVAHNRPPVSQNNPGIFDELFKHGGNNIPNMLNLANDSHLLQSSYNPMPNLNFSQQQQHQQQTASMSRLNPKAPEYSSYNIQQNKPAPHMYNGYQNNMYMPKQQQQQQGVDNYHRTPGGGVGGLSSSQNRIWMQMQPPFTPQQQSELISGIAGMTLQNIAKFTNAGNEVLENGGELGIVNNSPNISPNLLPAAHNYIAKHIRP
uniref:Ankyrin repeat domain-containing protein 17-like n=1 Tax=Diabrotica virgifera virgifera TaxID=50390 RepID=A0A6P7GGN1_DIAVI